MGFHLNPLLARVCMTCQALFSLQNTKARMKMSAAEIVLNWTLYGFLAHLSYAQAEL